jgi:hypothetical protein
VVLLIGCDNQFLRDVTIKNDSSKTIRYGYKDIVDTLASGEDKNYNIDIYPYWYEIVPDNQPRSVRLGGDYPYLTFIDVSAIPLNIYNASLWDITISADDYIDKNGMIKLTVSTNAKETAFIYTSSPMFTVTSTSHYPLDVKWQIADGEMFVIIR